MSKKTSVLSRLQSLLKINTGSTLGHYNDEKKVEERYETREYGINQHFYVKKSYLDSSSTIDSLIENIDCYRLLQVVDHAGYEVVDHLSIHTGDVYIIYNNVEEVVARVDEFRVPGGLIASRYVGKPLAKNAKKR